MGTTKASKIDPYTIVDQDISRTAAISADCLKHAYVRLSTQGIAIGATPTTREEIVHVASAVGAVTGFHAMLNDSGTSTGITVDLKKNGVSMLSSTISLTHSTGDRTEVDGTLSSTAIAIGDILSVAWVVATSTVATSTGAQGPVARLSIVENSSPA